MENVKVGHTVLHVGHTVLHSRMGVPSFKNCSPFTSVYSHCCLVGFCLVSPKQTTELKNGLEERKMKNKLIRCN